MPVGTTQKLFTAAPGASFNDEQAQAFGEFLEGRAGLAAGPVSPAEIVKLSRPKRSPTHSQFTWDDTQAAEERRLDQARSLVNHIRVVAVVGKEHVATKAFHSVVVRETKDDPPTRGYVSQEVVWRSPNLRMQVVNAALRELRHWQQELSIYDDLTAAVDQVGAAIESLEAAA
jgi:hypothetical protein